MLPASRPIPTRPRGPTQLLSNAYFRKNVTANSRARIPTEISQRPAPTPSKCPPAASLVILPRDIGCETAGAWPRIGTGACGPETSAETANGRAGCEGKDKDGKGVVGRGGCATAVGAASVVSRGGIALAAALSADIPFSICATRC